MDKWATLDETRLVPKETYVIDDEGGPDNLDVDDLQPWDKVIVNGKNYYVHTCYECKHKCLKPTMCFIAVRIRLL